MRYVTALLSVALLAHTGCATSQTNAPSPTLIAAGYRASPMKPCGVGQYCVEVTITGENFNFLIDTGSSFSIADPALVKKLKLPLDPKRVVRMAEMTGQERKHSLTEPVFVRIGKALLPPVVLAVVSLEPIRRNTDISEDVPLDGIVGSSILKRHDAIIDYGTKFLYLRTANPDPTRTPPARTATPPDR